MTSAQKALSGLESHETCRNGIPAFCPRYTSTLLKINCQMKPSTMPPIRLGRKKPARNRLCPFMFFVSTRASRNATALIRRTVNKT
ncbi:hypothetical protein D3C75_1198340 [compost metagenome]